jgi:threonine synthase
MVVAVAKALEAGSRAIVCASTGNTAASAAAYGAAVRMEVVVVLPKGQVAQGKLLQAQVAGARVVGVDGNFDRALQAVRELVEPEAADGAALDRPVTLVNSVNPHRLAGQKTAAFEICEDLGGAPDYLAIPVGNAGNISAYWQGFTDYFDAGFVDVRPRMLGFQAAGAAPLVLGQPVVDPTTVATAIRIGRPASAEGAARARDESGGTIDAVTDDEIMAAYRDLARYEGIFCEPASAASVAGVRKLVSDGRIDPGATIVCVLTGHGLKDPDTAARIVAPLIVAPPTAAGIRQALDW